MKFYGLELRGKFWIQRLPDLTDFPHSAEDEGRLVYNEADDIMYYGSASQWVQSTQSRYTFNVGQQIIFCAAASGGAVLPDDWNIVDDIDDRCPMITNIESQVGQRGGDWTMSGIVVAAGAHTHDLSDPSATTVRGTSEIYGSVGGETHRHTISMDGSHTHAFDGSWRFPHVHFTVAEYQPS